VVPLNLGRSGEQIYDKGTYIGAYLLCGIGGSMPGCCVAADGCDRGRFRCHLRIAGLLIPRSGGKLAHIRASRQRIMRSLLGFAGTTLLFWRGRSASAIQLIWEAYSQAGLGGLDGAQPDRDPRPIRRIPLADLCERNCGVVVLFHS